MPSADGTADVEPAPLNDFPHESAPPPVVQDDTHDATVHDDIMDIEHASVADDPRAWSNMRKMTILLTVCAASLCAGLGANIHNPSIKDIEKELNASSSDISLTLSLFVLVQGIGPLLWTAISEIKGRKVVYVVAMVLFTVGSAVVATSESIELLIGMRVLQSAGSSAAISIGAATLADIYEPTVRGRLMGIYYCSPLLGPALGPILGGVLTQAFNWRAGFWLLVAWGGLNCVSFLFLFKDTFRRERSLTYQSVVRRIRRERLQNASAYSSQGTLTTQALNADLEKTPPVAAPPLNKKPEETPGQATAAPTMDTIKVSLKDVNPITPLWQVLRRINNLVVLTGSGLTFAFGYFITYTSSRSLSSKYNYNALQIGLVLLTYGVGSMAGSIVGGRWSDYVLARLKAQNNGQSTPEMRLQSTKLGMLLLPPCSLAFGWVVEKRVHIAAPCVFLFLCGFFSLWMYSSTLAYIVDANTGRSSTAFAGNSLFRGVFAFVATELAVPLQNALGDGWLYTLWAGLVILINVALLLVMWKGERWRESARLREQWQQVLGCPLILFDDIRSKGYTLLYRMSVTMRL